jgi:hypothetical protein
MGFQVTLTVSSAHRLDRHFVGRKGVSDVLWVVAVGHSRSLYQFRGCWTLASVSGQYF